MVKWFGWIAYVGWGLLCLLLFLRLLFPYDMLGRRILHAIEEKTTLTAQPSATEAKLFGLRWKQVRLSSPREKNLPAIQIQNWAIQLHPLSLFLGRLSMTSRGTVMSGAFHLHVVLTRKGQRGIGEWKDVQIDRVPLFFVEGALSGGTTKGTVIWETAGHQPRGEASFVLRDGRIEGLMVAGQRLPLLNLGEVKGRMTWEVRQVELKEVDVSGGDVKAELTGRILLQNPLLRSKLDGRLAIAPTQDLIHRYPALKALYGSVQNDSRPLVFEIAGTPQAPKIALTR
jgi:type II secretion system protein N